MLESPTPVSTPFRALAASLAMLFGGALLALPLRSASAAVTEARVAIACDAPISAVRPDLATARTALTVSPASVDPGKPLHLVFALKPSASQSQIDAFVESQRDPQSPNYRKWLTSEQFGARFGASDAQIAAVRAFAEANGMTVTHVWPNRLFLSADTDVAHAQSAFAVTLRGFVRPAVKLDPSAPATFFAPSSAPTVPSSVASALIEVAGLSDYRRVHPMLSRSLMPAAPGDSAATLSGLTSVADSPPPAGPQSVLQPAFSAPLTPQQVSSVYNVTPLFNAGATGSGIKVAIYSPTQRYTGDPQAFANQYNLGVIQVSDRSVDGGATDTSSGGMSEASLDVEIVEGQASASNIIFYECPNNFNNLLDAYNQMVTDHVNVITSSWSGDEIDYQQSDASVYNNVLLSAQSAGISVFNASGDTGAYNATGTTVTTQFHASSPYVTGVGGTALPTDNNGSWSSEVAWSYDPTTNSGSGGGVSRLFARPSWQTGPGVTNGSSNGFREVPDISALADLNTPGYSVLINGQFYASGGTSASAPLWGSVVALMDQLAGTRLGNINGGLYWIGTNFSNLPVPVFHDVTSGSNGAYSCTQYWDYVTGWGSADFTKLYYDLAAKPNLFPYNPGTVPGVSGTWVAPIVIHASSTDVTEPSSLQSGVTYNIGACIDNGGPADVVSSTNSIQIDGVNYPFTFPQIAANYHTFNANTLQFSFTPGAHTIKLIADSTGSIAETNESDNVYTRTITVGGSVQPSVAALTVSDKSVQSGGSVTGTVTLNTAAGSGGVSVALSSNNGAATVPSTVTVPAGATTATFTVNAGSVSAYTNVLLTASYSGTQQSANLIIAPPGLIKFDLNSDGAPDLMWWNSQTGAIVGWLMNGTSHIASLNYGSVASPYQPVGEPDINGDGKSDLLFWNSQTGQIAAWYLSNGAVTGYTGVIGQASTVWRPEAIGSQSGGYWWLIWRNTQTTQVAEWLMHGTQMVTAKISGTIGSASWKIIGTPDLNNDGNPDILFYNTSTNELAGWLMNGPTFLSATGVFLTAPTGWQAVATLDINLDGHQDILFYNPSTGQIAAWYMNGTRFLSATGVFGQISDLHWGLNAEH